MTRSQRKRAAILDAAIAEFQARGFRDTSMDRVAERADVSKRTVYNHFASKDELFAAITGELMRQVQHATEVPFDPQRPLEAQLRELAHHEVELFTSKSFLGIARVLMAEGFRSPELVRNAFANFERGDDGITAWVRAATEAGRLEADAPELAAQQFIALLKGPLFWPQALGFAPAPKKKERAAIIESSVRVFLDHYEA